MKVEDATLVSLVAIEHREYCNMTCSGTGSLLVDRLASAHEADRLEAEEEFIRLGRQPTYVCARIAALLEDDRPEVRYRAAYVLGHVGDASVLDSLQQACDDPDEDVRYDAMIAVGYLGDRRAIPWLIERMREGLTPVGHAAAISLARLGQCVLPDLIAASRDQEATLRAMVARVLGMITAADGMDALIELTTDSNRDVRMEAAEALGGYDSTSARAALSSLSRDDDPDVAATARWAVAETSDREGGSS